MSVNANGTVSDALLDKLNGGLDAAKRSKQAKGGELDQNAFLTMMLAQMKSQDPLKPLDPSQQLAQLAQFTNVTELQKLNQGFKEMTAAFAAQRALSAAALIGRQVLVEGGSGWLPEDGQISGRIPVDDTVDRLTVRITDAQGRDVRVLDLGSAPAGAADFVWDGRDARGEALPAGLYTVRAEGERAGKTQQFTTAVSVPVHSVSLDGSGGIGLNLPGLGSRHVDEVIEIF